MQAPPVVMCLQDTTELDFGGKASRGLGPLSYETQRDMYVHPTYAVTAAHEPLGVIGTWTLARAFKGADGVRPGVSERWSDRNHPPSPRSTRSCA